MRILFLQYPVSEYKFQRGGKGLGRFIWLKAFNKVEISSVFFEPSEGTIERRFTFDENYDPDNAPSVVINTLQQGTTVRLVGYKEPYKSECPKNAEQIAQRLIEHFLLIFLHGDCPEVELHDQGIKINLNKIFERDFKSTATQFNFNIKDKSFALHGFRLTTPRVNKHRLIYAANQRGVISERLDDFIPNLSGRLTIDGDQSFVYLAVVQSEYLNQRVNNVRTDFEISPADDADADQGTLFEEEIRRSEIRDECTKLISTDLAGVISSINDLKEENFLVRAG